jgi:predicted NBD/HSP70 family sugar kinase
MKYKIGIDVGGTKILVALIKGTKIIKSKKEYVNKRDYISLKKQIFSLVDTYYFNYDIELIGISFPGRFKDNGEFLFSGGSYNFIGKNLKRDFLKKYGVEILLKNDTECFALAEYKIRKLKNKRLIGIIWGTGIGVSLVEDGKIVDYPLEVGHVVMSGVNNSGVKCSCGKSTCVECFASWKNVSKRYKKISNEKLTIVNEFVKLKDSKEIVSDMINSLSYMISIVKNSFNPDVIVLGGGVSNIVDKYYLKINKLSDKLSLNYVKQNNVVRFSSEDYIGVIGAVLR